ncbi:receptor-like protein 46 [Quercus suber]|uniref:receptor-like protein 46 n=1 Tax=Quercus suber TaxID=58331 RepID=UPI0032DEEFBC
MAKLSLLVLLLLLVLLTFVTTSLFCPEHQKQALLHFKASIINATSLTETTLHWLDSWNSSSDCCHWDGVICSTHFGSKTVLALYLDNFITSNSEETLWLPSTILTPLFHIRSLMHLDFSNNSIEGELPRDGFGNLTKLVHLDLGLNDFNGSIPSQLFHLSLVLSINKLTGRIPSSILKLTKLETLQLDDNMLVGEIPSGLSNIKCLKILVLGGNHLTWNNNAKIVPRTTSMENYQATLVMPLHSKFLGWMTTIFLASIVNIYALTLLCLSNNKFSGNTLPDFRSNEHLQLIDLFSNEFSGEIPTNFSHHTEILALGKNNFSGNLSRNLIHLRKLEYLDIHDNKITSELPNFIFQISTLHTLNLRNNSLHGSIPICISNLTNIQILDLSNNYLVGEIPAKFGNLVGMIETTIEFSYLDFSYLSDFIAFDFDIIFKQNNIDDVTVIWKKSKQDLSLGRLKIYYLLDLSMNQLSGEISASLGNLKALKHLNISYNNLYGSIPTSLGCIENVENVSNNKLTGKIPIGSQMDTMDDPSFYANNSGLCRMQIRVPCLEDLPPTKPPRVENKKTWFSWEGLGIGYAIGFFVTVGILYLTDSFVPTKPPNYRHQQGRQKV